MKSKPISFQISIHPKFKIIVKLKYYLPNIEIIVLLKSSWNTIPLLFYYILNLFDLYNAFCMELSQWFMMMICNLFTMITCNLLLFIRCMYLHVISGFIFEYNCRVLPYKGTKFHEWVAEWTAPAVPTVRRLYNTLGLRFSYELIINYFYQTKVALVQEFLVAYRAKNIIIKKGASILIYSQ